MNSTETEPTEVDILKLQFEIIAKAATLNQDTKLLKQKTIELEKFQNDILRRSAALKEDAKRLNELIKN